MYLHHSVLQTSTTYSNIQDFTENNIANPISRLADIIGINQDLVNNVRRSGEIKSSLIALILPLLVSISGLNSSHAQSIGLHVVHQKHVLFGIDLQGGGDKLIWHSNKAAFRAGALSIPFDTLWNENNLGGHSASFGKNNLASGSRSMSWGDENQSTNFASTSFGQENIASGTRSTAWGYRDTASSFHATAWGVDNHASELESTVWGRNNTSAGSASTVWGEDNKTTGNTSTVWGFSNEASNSNSTSWGANNQVSGNQSTSWGTDNQALNSTSTVWGMSNVVQGKEATSWGNNNIAKSYLETVIGRYADTLNSVDANGWAESDQLFVVGNGAANTHRNNALTIYKNGVAKFSPQDAQRSIEVDSVINGTFVEPIIRPSAPDWGYVGSEDNYFTKIYSNKFFAGGVGNYQVFSDRRLKSNISEINDGIAIIQSLHPVSYNLKKVSKKRLNAGLEHGLIAQEVERVLPNLVHTHPSGMKSVGYQGLIPFLIKGMQEQQTMIVQLQEENEQLETDLAEDRRTFDLLYSKLQQLEKEVNVLKKSIQK